MTSFDYIWVSANPRYREHLRRANEARAAAYYAAWRGVVDFVTGGIRRLAASVNRAHRRRQTLRELSELSDHQLNDIGLSRAELPFIADSVAVAEQTSVTLAHLRHLRSASVQSGQFPAARRPADDRRRFPAPRSARQADARAGRAAA